MIVRRVVHPPQVHVKDFYEQEVVEHVHPIVNVNRVHKIIVNKHVFEETCKTECDTIVKEEPPGC